jgi:hypothetical protein
MEHSIEPEKRIPTLDIVLKTTPTLWWENIEIHCKEGMKSNLP